MRKIARSREAGFSVSAYIWNKATIDIYLFELADELSAARYELKAASARLTQAERRLASQSAAEAKEPLPSWYEVAELAEHNASALIGRLCARIAAVPARSKAGLAIKLLLLSDMFADDEAPISEIINRGDIGAKLVTSVLRDIGTTSSSK